MPSQKFFRCTLTILAVLLGAFLFVRYLLPVLLPFLLGLAVALLVQKPIAFLTGKLHFPRGLSDLTRTAPGAYNIPEPLGDEPEATDETALILMPGLAFDSEGHRCGYGGGFYDKYLSAHPQHPTLALCYGFQLYPHLDVDAFDVPVDVVLASGRGDAE